MGYEIAGGLGVKMADPSRDVFVMVGDGSYLMMAQEIVTSVQEGFKLIIVLLDSQGYASIGGLSRSVGSGGFGTQFDYKVPVDLAANAESLGAIVHRASRSRRASRPRCASARAADRTTVIYAESIRIKACPATNPGGTCRSRKCQASPTSRAARVRWQDGKARQRR